jgi:hypothetical protein
VLGAGLIPASPALAADSASVSQVVTTPEHREQEQVRADVLGLGYEQIIRLAGAQLQIVDPESRGGALLRSFDVGPAAARLAVFGQTINVASNYGDPTRTGSAIRQYQASGVLTNERTFPIGVTIASMRAYVEAGRAYLSVDFGEHGSRVLHADRLGLPDVPHATRL